MVFTTRDGQCRTFGCCRTVVELNFSNLEFRTRSMKLEAFWQNDMTKYTESDVLAPPFWRQTIWRHRFGARTFGRRTVGRQENWAPDNWARECKEQDHEIIDYLHEIFQRLWVRPALRTPKSSVKEIPITLPTSQSNKKST